MSSAKAQQREYWNGPVGERWAGLQESIDLHLAEITEELVRFAAPRCGERVLDVGCGCGTTTLLLAMRTGPDGATAGIDISVPMLNVARVGSNIVISWSGTGYHLECASLLSNPNSATVWGNLGASSPVTLSLSGGGQKFFRLVCP